MYIGLPSRRSGLLIVTLAGIFSTIFFGTLFIDTRRDSSYVNTLSTLYHSVFNPGLSQSTDFVLSNDIWPRSPNVHHNQRILNQLRFNFTDKNYYSNGSEFLGLGVVDNGTVRSTIKIFLVAHWKNPPDGEEIFHRENCSVRDCLLTTNHSDFQVADAVLFQTFTAGIRSRYLPKPKHQVWIVTGFEPPPLNDALQIVQSRLLGNLVNWTSYYRRDSTIPTTFGQVFEIFSNFTRIGGYEPDANYALGKTKKVAWFVSNCWMTPSGRQAYATELGKYIVVDTYGMCGKMHCPKTGSKNCFMMLRKEYKFYLAFENSNCKDYITEKLHRNALANNVLPIVMGASRDDYEAVAPPGSFIHVDDFSSPRELAAYLKRLDGDDALYNEYFRWKSSGRYVEDKYWCRLCAMLHAKLEQKYVHWYEDFHSWWHSRVCLESAPGEPWQSWRTHKLAV